MAANYVEIKVKASDDAKPDLTELKAKLDELGHKVETARVNVDDQDAAQRLLRLNAKLAELNRKTANPRIKVDGAARAEADIHAVEMSLDDLNRKADSAGAGGGITKALDKVPSMLGPLLAVTPVLTSIAGAAAAVGAGLAGAFVTGGIAAAAFGGVAKSVLSQAETASQTVQAAQDAYTASVAHGTKQAAAYKTEQIAIAKAYAEMSPAQVKLSKELGDMSDHWAKVKQSVTPLIASSLQPWLKGITDAMGSLKPVIQTIAPVIADLGHQFDGLVKSSVFDRFRTFIAAFGSWSASAIGGALINSLKAFMILLPQFGPLIGKAVEGIQKLGTAFLNWAGSKNATNDITKFMDWFKSNGPSVGQLIRNVAGALKALTPGLGAASTGEMNALSGFFGMIAKLPPSIAKPLTELAAAMLTLNKLGVVKVGLKLLGPQGSAVEGEAAAGGAAGLWAKLLPGVRLVGGALVVTLLVRSILKGTSSGPGGKNWWDNPGGADPTSKDPSKQGVSTWVGLGHQIEHAFDAARHAVASLGNFISGSFDQSRHAAAAAADGIANAFSGSFDQTRHQVASVGHDIAHAFDSVRHDIASKFDGVRSSIASAFSGAGSWLVSTGSSIIHGLESGVKSAWSAVSSWFGGIGGKIGNFFSGAGSWLVSAGKAVMDGLIHGIESMLGVLGGVIGRVAGMIKSIAGHLGIHSPSTVMFGYGVSIMDGLMGGIGSRYGGLRSQMAGISGLISGMPGGGPGGGAGQLQLKVAPGGGSAFEQFMVMAMRNYVRVRGGNVQSVLGH